MKTMFLKLFFTVLCILTGTANAQTYPVKPIRLLVPFAPGGSTDLIARIVAEPLGKLLGQTVVVENKAGGGGTVGALEVARAGPDGYTLGLTTASSAATNPAINPSITYKPLTDFTPIINMVASPNVLAIHPSFPAKDMASFLKELRAQPGKFDNASSATGGIGHLQMELFKNLTKIFVVHIPYAGSGPALRDTVGGQVPIIFDNLPSAMSHIKDKRLIALAVATPDRVAELPDVPTFEENNISGMIVNNWFGAFAPARLPADVLAVLHKAVLDAMHAPDVRAKLGNLSLDINTMKPAEFDTFLKQELEKWGKVVKAAGIKAD